MEETVAVPAAIAIPKTALGIGKYAKELLLEGKSNKEALEKVKDKFPTASTTMASINWYRNDLRVKGQLKRADPEVKKAVQEAQAAAKAEKAAAKVKAAEAKALARVAKTSPAAAAKLDAAIG